MLSSVRIAHGRGCCEGGHQWVGKVAGQQSAVAKDRIGQQFVAGIVLDEILLDRLEEGALLHPQVGGAHGEVKAGPRGGTGGRGRALRGQRGKGVGCVHVLDNQRRGNVVEQGPEVRVVLGVHVVADYLQQLVGVVVGGRSGNASVAAAGWLLFLRMAAYCWQVLL